jgi:hypothetical protein
MEISPHVGLRVLASTLLGRWLATGRAVGITTQSGVAALLAGILSVFAIISNAHKQISRYATLPSSSLVRKSGATLISGLGPGNSLGLAVVSGQLPIVQVTESHFTVFDAQAAIPELRFRRRGAGRRLVLCSPES